jgi:hypothetical protein
MGSINKKIQYEKKNYLHIFRVQFFCLSQENCFNGIDDNGDNLIDLNDPLCACNFNLLPNPSFETFSSLPDRYGQINRAIPWVSTTNASPDYFITPEYFGYQISAPFPDGNGIAGVAISEFNN